jgi:hypothetical protein
MLLNAAYEKHITLSIEWQKTRLPHSTWITSSYSPTMWQTRSHHARKCQPVLWTTSLAYEKGHPVEVKLLVQSKWNLFPTQMSSLNLQLHRVWSIEVALHNKLVRNMQLPAVTLIWGFWGFWPQNVISYQCDPQKALPYSKPRRACKSVRPFLL